MLALASSLISPLSCVPAGTLLDDERFFASFRAYFDATFGRPSMPVESHLRGGSGCGAAAAAEAPWRSSPTEGSPGIR
jgi:hypothetical protein